MKVVQQIQTEWFGSFTQSFFIYSYYFLNFFVSNINNKKNYKIKNQKIKYKLKIIISQNIQNYECRRNAIKLWRQNRTAKTGHLKKQKQYEKKKKRFFKRFNSVFKQSLYISTSSMFRSKNMHAKLIGEMD